MKQHYDGTFSGTLTDGPGVTAQLLIENGYLVTDVEELLAKGSVCGEDKEEEAAI